MSEVKQKLNKDGVPAGKLLSVAEYQKAYAAAAAKKRAASKK